MNDHQETIAAIATPPGRGGIGVIRISGPLCAQIAAQMLGRLPEPRKAVFRRFKAADNSVLDEGLALYFPAPNSFTGEDVLELQGHGGPVILDMLMERILALGARAARPGEFSERAFLNGRMDLAQAESIADLIDAGSRQAARAALRSLEGEFSRRVNNINRQIIEARMYVEAAIDFPEDEIDFLADSTLNARLERLDHDLGKLLAEAQQGRILREGINIVLAGKPNAGKSSLLNALAGTDSAIVTDIPGTTRDILREYIQIEGVPLHIVDTAGLREQPDRIEAEGIRRAREAFAKADLILLVIDDREYQADHSENGEFGDVPVLVVRNKIDLTGCTPGTPDEKAETATVAISATTGAGLRDLRRAILKHVSLEESGGEFTARRRHIDALVRTQAHLSAGRHALSESRAGELLAEELNLAHLGLSEITGEFTADDLLGEIFASFCIGK